MALWWLQPGWRSAVCPHCGVNIWKSGGDPDWGECYACKLEGYEQERMYQQQEPEPYPVCDICGKYEAVNSENGYCVCSIECADIARKKQKNTYRK